MARNKEIEGLPGWRPVKRRPKCIWCQVRMRPFVVNRFDPQPNWPSGAKAPDKIVPVAVRYGYYGGGRFCSSSCGYSYAMAAVGGAVDHSKPTELPDL